MSAIGLPLADNAHPWIGLASFTEGDREFFAGRSEESDDLVRLVRRDTLTLLYGVSGLGKTSLLQAGLFPRLHADDFLPVLIRLDHLDDSARLSGQVHRAIASAAAAAGVERPDLRGDETLWEYFHRLGHNFWSRRNEPVTPVLVFDQFEELFTLGRETPERARRAEAFIAELAEAVENLAPPALRADPQRGSAFDFKPVRLKVILAMREDYLAGLDRLRSRFRDLGRNRMRLLPMGEGQARAVIALGAPLLAAGVEDRILAFVAGRHSTEVVEDVIIAPALLSLVLRELNERRLARSTEAKITADLLDLEQTKILEAFYLRSLEGCPAGARIFIEDALLTANGYRNSCALDDALARPGVTLPVLDELVNRRLLAYEDRHHTRRVELTHDVLVAVVSASRRARRTREEREHADAQELEALARAEAARASAEKKARAARRQLLVAGGLIAVAGVSAAFGFLGRSRALTAERQVKEAVARGDVDIAILLQQKMDAVAPQTLAHLARALRTQPDAQRARELLVSLLRDSPWCLPAMEPLRVGGAVTAARFTPEGRQIVTVSRDGTVREWDATVGTLLGEHSVPEKIQGLSEDGRRLLTVADDKTVRVWETHTGTPTSPPIRQEAWGGRLAAANFSADAKRVVTASGGFGGDARVWNADTGEAVGAPSEKGEGVMAASLSRDGRQLMTIFSEMEISAYGRVGVQPWTDGPGPKKYLRSGNLAVFSGDGRQIVVAGERGVVQTFEIESGQARGEGPRHGAMILSASFSPDGQWVVSGSRDETARVWNAETGQPRGEPLVHASPVVAVRFSQDGQQVLSVSQDNIATVWNAESSQLGCEPLRHDAPIATAFFSPAGTQVLTASEDKTARLWDLNSGAATGRPLAGTGTLAATFSPDGSAVIRISRDGSTQTWDAESGEARGTGLPAREGIGAGSLSADGQRLVSVSRSDGSAQVWDTHTSKTVGKPIVHKDANEAIEARLSADGTRIVTSYSFPPPNVGQQPRDGNAQVWDVETGQRVGGSIPVKPGYRVDSVSADGRVIITTPDNAAQMWDARSGRPVGQQLRHEGRINAASFSRDGNQIVTASDDETARLWDGHSGEPITEALRHKGAVRDASFSRDATRIVVSGGQTVSIWDARSGTALGRPLRQDQMVVAAAFSPDNQRIVTLSDKGLTLVLDVAVDARSTLPKWLPELAEALGGQRFNEAGLLVPAKSIVELRHELMTAGGPRELKGEDFWSRFGRWFFTRGADRTISPNSTMTLGQLERFRVEAALK